MCTTAAAIGRQSFSSATIYLFFLKRVARWLLDEYVTDPRPVDILCYCLMPNHFHLLVRANCDDFSSRMQSLCQSYSKAINKRQERVGPLFQGRFQAREVKNDEYLLHLSRYIHLNPEAAGLVRLPDEWEFSSYRDYLGARTGRLPTTNVILRLFGDRNEYRRFVESEMDRVDPRIGDLLFDEE